MLLPPGQNQAIPCARQSIDQYDIDSVIKALKGPNITRGEQVSAFEKELATHCQVPFAIAFSSGSSALSAACLALDIKEGDHLFVPANTFIATASCGYLLGADLHFVDIDPLTGLLSADHLAELVDELSPVRSILFPVHFAGRAVNIAELERALGEHPFEIIEDSSHAIGSRDSFMMPMGSCCKSACSTFSFHASKNMTTGEGGAVTTKNEQLAARLRSIRNSGIQRHMKRFGQFAHPWQYEVQTLSSNHHLTDFAAALGRSQLKKLAAFQKSKKRAVERYLEQLEGVAHLKIPPVDRGDLIHFHLFFVLIDFALIGKTREELMLFLQKEQIGTGVHYIPLYRHPCWEGKNRLGKQVKRDALAGSELYYKKTLSLPLFADITLRQVDRVCRQIKSWLVETGNSRS